MAGWRLLTPRRLKALEDENTKLKKLLAEAMLDNAMLRDVAAPARSRNANESAAQCGSSSDSPQLGSRVARVHEHMDNSRVGYQL